MAIKLSTLDQTRRHKNANEKPNHPKCSRSVTKPLRTREKSEGRPGKNGDRQRKLSLYSNLKWLSRRRVAVYSTILCFALQLLACISGVAASDSEEGEMAADLVGAGVGKSNAGEEITEGTEQFIVESHAGRDIRLPCKFLDKVYSGAYSSTWIVEWEKTARDKTASETLYLAIWKNDDTKQWTALSGTLFGEKKSEHQKVNASTLELTLLNPGLLDTGFYRCKTRFNVTRVDGQKNIGPLSFVYDVIVQDRPNQLGQPEVRGKSSRMVKLRRNGKLVPNFSEIHQVVVEVEAPDNVTYEIPFTDMTANESFNLTELRPFTQYRFRIAAENKIGRGPWSQWSYPIITDEEAPGGKPASLKIQGKNETSLEVTWRSPRSDTLNGELKEFEIRWKQGDERTDRECYEPVSGGVERNTTVKASNLKQVYSYWIPDLEIFTCYSIRVIARNSKGQGPGAAILNKTDESTPLKPSTVTATDPDATKFGLTWSFTKKSSRGILTKFLCQYRVQPDTGENGLRRAPEVPRSRTDSNYDAPVDDEGAWMDKEYQCVFDDGANYCARRDNEVFEQTIDDLQPNTVYDYRVAGYTSKGRGLFSSVQSIRTEPALPGIPPKFGADKEEVEGKTAIRVRWNFPINASVDKYEIKIEDFTGVTENKILTLALGCSVNASKPKCETPGSARTKTAKPEDAFNLSDVHDSYNNASSGIIVLFRNWTRPTKFKIDVSAGIRSNNNREQSNFGPPASSATIEIGTNEKPEKPKTEPDIGKIVAIVVCAIIVLFVISAIVLAFTRSELPPCLRFFSRKYSGTDYFDASDGQMVSINEVASAIDSNIYQETDAPIPVSDFATYVHRGHANDNLGFAEDFEEILATCRNPPPAKNSEDQQNQVKNRYLNIVAYDHTRVKLKPLNGSGGKSGDYINANYIDGYQKAKAYIASQGPIPSTFEDFWQMVWENNTHVIIMVTNLIERGRLKCDQYWPVEGTQTYGNFEVHLAETAALAHYTVRNFHLRHRSHKGSKHKHRHERHERLVLQFHFTEWPDHGTPNHTLPILSFIRKSSASNPEGAGPMVVHCSAGVGRTGTYIVIDTMLKQIQDKETVNIKGFLKYIRQQRNHLVQTEDQYVFTHDVLLEAIHSDVTEVVVSSIGSYVEDLQSILLGRSAPGAEVTRLEHQMDLVASYIPDEYDLLNALKPVNVVKCRQRALAPVEHARVTLAPKPGCDGSDFINASFLHSYKRDATFIVTQHPLQTTIQDFWRLIWDYNVKTVVLLGAFEASNEFPMFWPDSEEETIKCDQFKVAFREREEVSLSQNGPSTGVGMDFILQANQDDYELCTRIFYFPGWSRGIVGSGAYSTNPLPNASTNGGVIDTSAPAPGTTNTMTSVDAVFEYVDQVGLWHVDHPSSFVVVVDALGGTDAATFCALSTLQEQIRAEQTVDAYQVAALYHFKRPGIWTSIADYHFLYLAIKSVAHQFEAPKRSQAFALNKNASSLSAGYDYLRHSPRLLRSASSRLGASFRGTTQRAASSPRDSPPLPIRALSGFAAQDFSIGAPSDSTPKTSHTSLARESPMTPPQLINAAPTSNYGCDQNSNNSSKVGTPQSHHSSNGFIENGGFKPTSNVGHPANNNPNHMLNGQTAPSPLVVTALDSPSSSAPTNQPPPPVNPLISSNRNADHRSNERLLTNNRHNTDDDDGDDDEPFPGNDQRHLDATDAYFRLNDPTGLSRSSEKVYHETEM